MEIVFLPTAAAARGSALGLIERAIRAEKLDVVGWRDVPVDPFVLGDQAAASLPVIRQVIVARPERLDPAEFECRLFLARRGIEGAAARTAGLEALHLPSLSSRLIVYKGLVRGSDLGRFYRDLAQPGLEIDLATFHQRFSTNTRPSWRLAQPFRYLAHNGEINTIRGNRQAMAGRSAHLGGGTLGRRLARAAAAGQPILDPDGSDSASLDEALELLLAAGWSLSAALVALVPESTALRDRPVAGLEEWQRAMASRLEPWDGPAALVFTDGRQVGALLDRNGLRPAAWEIRRDGLVVLASEAGLLAADPGEVIRRGRLGPGELFAVDPAAGLIVEDDAAKAAAIASLRLEPVPRPAATGRAMAQIEVQYASPEDPDLVRRRRLALGLDAEQLRLSVATMATSGREPLWSMGDDTPPAILGRRARGVSGYLRQAFAQVTNPPIDPERERLVMSLAIPLGPRPALLDPGATPRPTLLLDPPVIGAATLRTISDPGVTGWRVVTIDSTWPVSAGEGGLCRAIDRLVQSGLRAASRGTDVIVVSDARVSPRRIGIPSHLALGALNAALTAAGRQRLRDRVVLRTDGGLRTGRDVLIAALLGAEEYGFGTSALVAIGCDMARQCHLDTCPTGIATQREELRAKFRGTPEQVVAFFTAIAEDVRVELAAAGFSSLDEAIGRADRLGVGESLPLELARVIGAPAWSVPQERRSRAAGGARCSGPLPRRRSSRPASWPPWRHRAPVESSTSAPRSPRPSGRSGPGSADTSNGLATPASATPRRSTCA